MFEAETRGFALKRQILEVASLKQHDMMFLKHKFAEMGLPWTAETVFRSGRTECRIDVKAEVFFPDGATTDVLVARQKRLKWLVRCCGYSITHWSESVEACQDGGVPLSLSYRVQHAGPPRLNIVFFTLTQVPE